MTIKGAVMQLAVVFVLAGICLLCADSDNMEAFLVSKVIGGFFCLAGLAIIAHLDKRGA